MQSRPAALRDHLAARKPFAVHYLMWITARNRQTGAPEPIGLWSGADHQEIDVGGQVRPYFGAGGIVKMAPIRAGVGTDIRTTKVQWSMIAPEVEMAVRGYEPRQAPIEVHRLLIDPETQQAIGGAVPRLVGWINGFELTTVGGGEESRCDVSIVSSARAGTRKLSLKKSDATQRLRTLANGEPDRFYRYADISGAVPVKWGTK